MKVYESLLLRTLIVPVENLKRYAKICLINLGPEHLPVLHILQPEVARAGHRR